MSNNNSSTGGYLLPADPQVLEDDALDDFLQAVVVGVTGMDPKTVFPRWQEDVPNLPAAGTDWCGMGIMRQAADTYAVVTHDPEDDGADNLQRQEEIELLCSFYGPHGRGNAARLRDGLQIAQNREALLLARFGLTETGDIISLPSLVKEKWLRRFDLSVMLTRQIDRRFAVENLLLAQGVLIVPPLDPILFNVNTDSPH